jgi:hypothetical protein
VGAGGSLEATFSLRGPIAAGTWRLVADGIILEAVDVTFEILWRRDGEDDTVLLHAEQRFEPLPDGTYAAQAYEVTEEVGEVAAEVGDLLVFRYSGENSDLPMAYVPNGDGEHAGGRIPFIDLPP